MKSPEPFVGEWVTDISRSEAENFNHLLILIEPVDHEKIADIHTTGLACWLPTFTVMQASMWTRDIADPIIVSVFGFSIYFV